MTFLELLQDWDRHITLAFNQLSSPVSDWIGMLFSNREVWFVLYAVVAVMLVVRLGWKRGLGAIVCISLTIVVCDQGGNFVKSAVARFRPCWDSWMVQNGLNMLEGRGDYYGFYSAHAANAMGFAAGSTGCFRWNGGKCRAYSIGICIWALLVGFSRVFVGRHFFGDVTVGFFVGIVSGFLFARLGGILCSKLKIQ